MALSMIFTILHAQIFITPEYPSQDLTGQTIIVTGANTGLGLEAARHATRLNAEKVILAVRSTEKGEAARKSIVESTGRKDAVEVWLLDLGSYDSVRAFAKKMQELPRVDALVENAGINAVSFKMAEDNESTITVNVISTFLLALLALPKLRESAQKFNITPRLAIVASEVHAFSTLKAELSGPSIFEETKKETNLSKAARYPTSKLLEVLYVRKLAAAMSTSDKPSVTTHTLNPGWCKSELARELVGDKPPLFFRILQRLLARTTEVGSRTLIHGATAGPETHGKYMSDGKVAPTSSWVDSPDGQEAEKRVWKELNEYLERIEPGVTKNI